jgi:hypothetical protein
MKFPTVENFLFCLPLESGGFIMGWLSAIGATIGFIVSFFALGAAVFNYQGLVDGMIENTTEEQREMIKNSRFCECFSNLFGLKINGFHSSNHFGFIRHRCLLRDFILCECFADKKREKCS